jgi:hypothetical protein
MTNQSEKASKLFFVFIGLLLISLSAIGQNRNKAFRPGQLAEIKRIGILIGQGVPLSQVQNTWKLLISSDKNLDVEKAVSKVMAESKQEAQRKVAVAKERQQFELLLRKTISNEIKNIRQLLLEVNKTNNRAIFIQRKNFELTPDARGKILVIEAGTMTTKEDLKHYVYELETQLNKVGDDAQLANVDLQNTLQQQQQLIQMLSNVAKQLNDSAMSVIRKMGG